MSTIPFSLAGNIGKKSGLTGAATDLYNTDRQLSSVTAGQRGGDRSSLFPGYQSMLDSGYSPGEQSSISQQSINPIRNVYGSARSAATNRMARTRNSAGYGSFMGDLAQKEGEAVGGQSQSNQIQFAQEKQRRKEAGLQGIAGLYGVDTSFLSSLGQNELGALNIGNSVQARSRGVLGTIRGVEDLFPGLRGNGQNGAGGLMGMG